MPTYDSFIAEKSLVIIDSSFSNRKFCHPKLRPSLRSLLYSALCCFQMNALLPLAYLLGLWASLMMEKIVSTVPWLPPNFALQTAPSLIKTAVGVL